MSKYNKPKWPDSPSIDNKGIEYTIVKILGYLGFIVYSILLLYIGHSIS